MAILSAVDVEEAPHRPIAVGYDLATAYDEELVVTYVMPEQEFADRQRSKRDLPDGYRETASIDQANAAAAQKAREAVDATLDEYDLNRIRFEGRVGEAGEQILDLAEEIDPSFVVVGGRKRTPARKAIFGSVSQEVVRDAEQPVVTIMAEDE